MREPVFWSGITDELPEGHPLYWKTVYCVRCQQMVHGTPNENMQPWMETGRGPYCLLCFAAAWDEVEPEEWALRSDGSMLPPGPAGTLDPTGPGGLSEFEQECEEFGCHED